MSGTLQDDSAVLAAAHYPKTTIGILWKERQHARDLMRNATTEQLWSMIVDDLDYIEGQILDTAPMTIEDLKIQVAVIRSRHQRDILDLPALDRLADAVASFVPPTT